MKPLYDAISKYAEEAGARFHMPSHGGRELSSLFASAPFDATELPFSDNLNLPNGVILQAEKLLAEAYGVRDALMFTSGATSAVLVALATVRAFCGDTIVVERQAHSSVFSALRTLGFRSRFLTSGTKDESPQPMSAEALETALCVAPAAAVLVTSPDYFGRCADLASLRKVCDAHGSLLVVDSSHGAHLAFSPLLPPSATEFAHFAVLSCHKTMPVFTGGAVLAVNCDLFAQARVLRPNLVSTSPSYVTMCSIDYARELFSEQGVSLFEKLKKQVGEFKKMLPQFTFLPAEDWSKIYFNAKKEDVLRAGYYPELADEEGVLLIANFTNGDALEKLACALKNATPQSVTSKRFLPPCKCSCVQCTPTIVLPPITVPFEQLSLGDAVGRRVYSAVGTYPPGVPRLLPGDVLRPEDVDFLKNHKDSTFGFVNGKICVIIEDAPSEHKQ